MSDWLNKTHVGDCRALMREMAASGIKAQCIVTSPPYWGLRDYGVAAAIGLEPSLREWLVAIGEVFAAAWDVLEDDGLLWLNLGDAYAGAGNGEQGKTGQRARRTEPNRAPKEWRKQRGEFKQKDLMGQPWRVAFALQDAGWYLRADCIWHKLNPMPESVGDRPTKSHEYVFLLSKQPQYYYDASAIAEPVSGTAHARGNGVNPKAKLCSGWAVGQDSHSTKDHARAKQGLKDSTKFGRGPGWRNKQNESFKGAVNELVDTRNIRTVWSFSTEAQPEAHFATFPTELVQRCILSGSRKGDVILDPFMGSGTTARVATSLGRQFIGCELNPAYAKIQNKIGLQVGMAV